VARGEKDLEDFDDESVVFELGRPETAMVPTQPVPRTRIGKAPPWAA
jgi:hypothetical protein